LKGDGEAGKISPFKYLAHKMVAMILPLLHPMLYLTTPAVLTNPSPKVQLKASTVFATFEHFAPSPNSWPSTIFKILLF
jgi:hypothetical protein